MVSCTCKAPRPVCAPGGAFGAKLPLRPATPALLGRGPAYIVRIEKEVDELRALVIECAGESVVREAEAVDPEQAHTVLANLVADWNAGKDFDPGVYDFLLGRVVLRDDDSPRQFGMLKQQAVSELRAIVIRTWLTDMSRGVAATVCKALAGLGYGAHISKKGFALAPLDIAEAWNNLHPDEPPLDIVWD